MKYQAPHRIDQQNNDAKGVGDAVSLSEWVPEPTGCSDVLLQQVTTNEQAYKHANQTVPKGVCK